MSFRKEADLLNRTYYDVLGVEANASYEEIKRAYRGLVKMHHPDAGGDEKVILELNAAWEVLSDSVQRDSYDFQRKQEFLDGVKNRSDRNAHATTVANFAKGYSVAQDEALSLWLSKVYTPIDRSLAKVINSFPDKLRALSADPYDDSLMADFCSYLQESRKLIDKANNLYKSVAIPKSAYDFGLSLYHCLSQVDDALNELDRYTMGYVDSYLHDAQEMLREARKHRRNLQQQRRHIESK